MVSYIKTKIDWNLFKSSTALWFRISERLKLSLPFIDALKEEIWDYVKSSSHFEYFKIPENRPTPQSITRSEFFYENQEDPKLMKKYDDTYYIYKFQPIAENDKVWGSCEHYKTRIPIPLDTLIDQGVNAVLDR